MGREGIFVENKDQLWLQCEDGSDRYFTSHPLCDVLSSRRCCCPPSIVQLRVLELVCKIWQLSPECAEMSKVPCGIKCTRLCWHAFDSDGSLHSPSAMSGTEIGHAATRLRLRALRS